MKFQTAKGTRDIWGDEFYQRQYLSQQILQVMENYGFRQVRTPLLESLSLLEKGAGQEVIDQIYQVKDKGGRLYGLKSDITPALTRVVANYSQALLKPVKLCCYDRIYRYERPQKGRYREITQINAEMYGVKTAMSDVELLNCFSDCYQSIGLDEIKIEIGYRPLLEIFIKELGISKKQNRLKLIRLLDKKEKISQQDFNRESQQFLFNKSKKMKLANYLKLNGDLVTVFKKTKQFFSGIKPADKYLSNLEEIIKLLKNSGLDKKCKLNLTLARGSEYYTGIIFEAKMIKENKKLNFGMSIGAGGRYDNLVAFYGGNDTPALGFSIGIDRILLLWQSLKQQNSKKQQTPPIEFYIAAELTERCKKATINLAKKIRSQGKVVEIDLLERNLSEQLERAKKIKVKGVIIIKEQTIKSQYLILLNFKTGRERKVELRNFKKLFIS